MFIRDEEYYIYEVIGGNVERDRWTVTKWEAPHLLLRNEQGRQKIISTSSATFHYAEPVEDYEEAGPMPMLIG